MFDLIGKAIHLLVVEISRQGGIFIAPKTVNLILLAINITCVLGLNSNLLCRLKVWRGLSFKAGDICVIKLWPLQQVSQRVLPGERAGEFSRQLFSLSAPRL